MKTYKEMLRKLAAVGIPLMAVTLVFTLVKGGQACFGLETIEESMAAVSMLPVLRYYVFSAVIFAMYGFSFLFSRKASDVYHSLPVKRSDLYYSVTLATATWMGATILLNVLLMLLMLLISGCPFVPAYIPMSILFYFVASMLVFSAAAVGCALSGTIITALASTGVVLLLPRFVQFMFARGIVEKVPIVGWLDLGTLLDPSTNVATGLLTMTRRHVFIPRIITMPHILYSMLPMLALFFVGLWLFNRRQSEIAQKSGGDKLWDVIAAVLLSYAVMLPITMGNRSWISVYGGVLVLAALAVFFIYQLIVSQSLKRTFKILPCFLLAVCLSLGTSLLIDSAADSMLKTVPDADAIKSVTFRGYDMARSDPTYTTMLIKDIEFTDDETKEYVAESLASAVTKLQTEQNNRHYEYNPYQVIEPITIKLKSGKTIYRTIEFKNVDELNGLRMRNERFVESIRAFPPMDSIQYLNVDNSFSQEQNEAIMESYMAEAAENGLVNGYYYRERARSTRPDGTEIIHGTSQVISGISSAGYIGSTRYYNSDSIRLEAPDTVSLVMRTFNTYVEEEPLAELIELLAQFEAGFFSADDSLSFYLGTFNYPDESGFKVQETCNFHVNEYMLDTESNYNELQVEYFGKFADIMTRATMTDDTDGMFIRVNWYYYDSTSDTDYSERERPTFFVHFDNEEDEQAFLELMEEWKTAQRTAR